MSWVLKTDRPASWDEHLARCGGGFFHSSAWPAYDGRIGTPVWAVLRAGETVAGLAVGVRSGCRLARVEGHFDFPTLPAIPEFAWREPALAALARAIGRARGAELSFESFDSPWPCDATGQRASSRLEYRIPLGAAEAELAARCSAPHQRHYKRGERERWSLRVLGGREGERALRETLRCAVQRRGRGPMLPCPPSDQLASALDPSGPGMVAMGALHGETLLACALIGIANRRAFYLAGGSTPAGYQRSAAVWLHIRIASSLSHLGLTQYSLGGTPAGAAGPSDPAHGLFRFKRGFGADLVEVRGRHFVLNGRHRWLHEAALWVRRRSEPSR